jgi:hypothetical protein
MRIKTFTKIDQYRQIKYEAKVFMNDYDDSVRTYHYYFIIHQNSRSQIGCYYAMDQIEFDIDPFLHHIKKCIDEIIDGNPVVNKLTQLGFMLTDSR